MQGFLVDDFAHELRVGGLVLYYFKRAEVSLSESLAHDIALEEVYIFDSLVLLHSERSLSLESSRIFTLRWNRSILEAGLSHAG